MRILLANKFYYRRGGDCVCTLNLEELLKAHGHEVAIFAMQHPENLPTLWSKYFPSEVKFKPGIGMAEALMRPFGTPEVKRKFNALLDDFGPDVVHLNNIHSQLSPVIAELAHRRGIKVVWTLHDYKLLCPRYDCRRNGRVMCRECFMDKRGVLRHRCMKNSLFASLLSYYEALKWNRERLESCTDMFICPSRFMKEIMMEGGFDGRKLVTLCNFIDTEKCRQEETPREAYYCYVGRLSDEKGVQVLIEAAARLPYKLKLIGEGPLGQKLRDRCRELNVPVEFMGHMEWQEIKDTVSRARLAVMPSVVYENNPLSVIEALCLGTPVAGARMGGIPELIEEGVNGFVFESGNVEDMAGTIDKTWKTAFDYKRIAADAMTKFSSNRHYDSLLEIISRGGVNIGDRPSRIAKENYCCYVGRLSEEKGVGTLVAAAAALPYRLIVIGDGPMKTSLQAASLRQNGTVEFAGFRPWQEIKDIAGKARFCVVPSEWYENNPLSVIEALCLGTPVLGARIGGIPELIEEGTNGMTFESGNAEDLKEKLRSMAQAEFDYERIASDAIRRYSPEAYYEKLMKCYKEHVE